MTQIRVRQGFLATLAILSFTYNLGGAAYEPRVVLSFPFKSEYIDSLGNSFVIPVM
jgi:hypothetical protein